MKHTIESLKSKGIEPISDRELESNFRDMLDEVYGTVKIGAYEYDTSLALERVDPIAFREDFNNYLSSAAEDGLYVEIDGAYFEAADVEGLDDD